LPALEVLEAALESVPVDPRQEKADAVPAEVSVRAACPESIRMTDTPSSVTAKTEDGNFSNLESAIVIPAGHTSVSTDANTRQLDEIKALTMHNMVDCDASGSKKMIFLTNYQAQLFDSTNIKSFMESFEFPKPKLVIWFMPCCGGSSTINSGMIPQFKKLKHSDPDFEQKWKKLLKVQAVNSPDPV